jgi:hypothetical protein
MENPPVSLQPFVTPENRMNCSTFIGIEAEAQRKRVFVATHEAAGMAFDGQAQMGFSLCF